MLLNKDPNPYIMDHFNDYEPMMNQGIWMVKNFIEAFINIKKSGSNVEETAAEWYQYWGKVAWLKQGEYEFGQTRTSKVKFQPNMYVLCETESIHC